MINVLLSIRPKYVTAIMSNNKLFEFRKSIFRSKSVKRVFIYATSPVGKVVGSFKVGRIIKATPDRLWEMYGDFAGVSYEEFLLYFSGNIEGYAIEIKNLKKFEPPINPKTVIDNFAPPRSFIYINGQFNGISQSAVSSKVQKKQ